MKALFTANGVLTSSHDVLGRSNAVATTVAKHNDNVCQMNQSSSSLSSSKATPMMDSPSAAAIAKHVDNIPGTSKGSDRHDPSPEEVEALRALAWKWYTEYCEHFSLNPLVGTTTTAALQVLRFVSYITKTTKNPVSPKVANFYVSVVGSRLLGAKVRLHVHYMFVFVFVVTV